MEASMEAQVKIQIPYAIKWGLDELYQTEQDIRELRKIQTAVGYGQFGSEKDIAHLRYIASQIALESIERVCRETREDVRERFTTKTSSEEVEF
jgi:hypothetical protein